nr:MAG TPA: hypothetical protein [Caudoviricetes sp.]
MIRFQTLLLKISKRSISRRKPMKNVGVCCGSSKKTITARLKKIELRLISKLVV